MDDTNLRSVERSNTAVLFRAFLWLLQFLLGATLGFVIADASVTTHVAILEPGGRATRVHVEVRVLDFPIHEESGFVNTEDGIWELRGARRVTVSIEQFLIVYGIIAGATLLGSMISLVSFVHRSHAFRADV
jgi:hypothetical protein